MDPNLGVSKSGSPIIDPTVVSTFAMQQSAGL